MLQNEVKKLTGLTRKAIEYYEEKLLINPIRKDNNYREYSMEDVKTLKKISVYRKLGCSIDEIKEIINDKGKLASIIRNREIKNDLEIEKVEILKNLMNDEFDFKKLELIENKETLYFKLTRIFPGYVGQLFFISYKPFLNEILKDEDKQYYHELIDFLDNFPTIDLSDYEKELIDNISKSISIFDIEKISDEKINAIMDYDKWINNNEENISNYIKFKESEEYLNNPVIIILEKVKKHMEDNKYYEIVIPLIRKISKSYDEYYKQMLKANKKLMENI